MMRRLDTQEGNFRQSLRELLEGDVAENIDVLQTVDRIIKQVRTEGDRAVVALTNQFDRLTEPDMDALKVTAQQLADARAAISEQTLVALQQAEQRVRAYAERQKMDSWQYQEEDGTVLGQQVTPLDSVGVYVPGGTAAYPSSVLMNVVPAKVAGVARIVMVVPTPDGVINDMVLAAAEIAGVDEIYRIGGAQAVAALAYGTETIAPVDKSVGPGNIYVAMAKRQVFGKGGIDMIAGPSEILVLCDGSTNPDWVAMDLFSQAEHDVLAQSILVCPDAEYIARVEQSIDKLLPEMPRKDIIRQSLADRGAVILTRDMEEAIEVANMVAAEHLELSVSDPQAILPRIRHAGAIFMGAYSTEVLGD